ncbi:MAG: M48 family metallopeptidase [Lentisphaeraceae bacterium]|nr:M48 family metallopeptidase [Lentisphaeraceae bacterium]
MELKLRVLGETEPVAPKSASSADTEETTSSENVQSNPRTKIQNLNFTDTGKDEESEPYTIEELENAFTGDYTKSTPGILYLIGIGLLIPLMLSLIVVYGAIASGLVWVIMKSWPESYFAVSGEFTIVKLGSTISIVISSIVFLFMVKPLMRFFKRQKRIEVKREDEPLIYEFIDLLCDKIDAPRPKKIELCCEANAAASLEKGMLSLFSKDMVMTIGIPFIEGMNMRELTGILSHEIGHFAQNAGMKLTYIVRAIYYWFALIVFDRDWIDELLYNLRKKNRFSVVRGIFSACYLFVLIPKIILWVFIMLAHFLGNFMLRQMEYDADRYKTQAGGSEQFEKTAFKVLQMGYAEEKSFGGLSLALETKRVVDDFPGYISASYVSLTKNENKQIKKYLKFDRGSIGDTHPPMKKRVKAAMKSDCDGIFKLETPASRLFQNLKKIKKEITEEIYEDRFGRNWQKELKCVPSIDLINEMREMGKSWDCLDGFFQGVISFRKPLEFKKTDSAPGGGMESSIQQLTSLRKSMLEDIHKLRDTHDEYLGILDFKSRSSMARKLIDLNLPRQASFLVGYHVNRSNMNKLNSDVSQKLSELEESLNAYNEKVKKRILIATSLLNMDEFRQKMNRGNACQNNLKLIMNNIAMVNSLHMPIMNMKNNFISILVILDTAPALDASFYRGLNKLADNLGSVLKTQKEKMKKIPFPFPHSQGDISLGDYVIEELPGDDDPVGKFLAAEEVYDKISNLYFRILGQLILIVEQVEIAAGLGPFPDYVEQKDKKKKKKKKKESS